MKNSPLVLNPSCLKTLSAVEASIIRSNQREIHGVKELKGTLFGTEKIVQDTKFSIRGTDIECNGSTTWYDGRIEADRPPEYRLYYGNNEVMRHAKEGDDILIGKDSNAHLHIVLIQKGSPTHLGNISSWQQSN